MARSARALWGVALIVAAGCSALSGTDVSRLEPPGGGSDAGTPATRPDAGPPPPPEMRDAGPMPPPPPEMRDAGPMPPPPHGMHDAGPPPPPTCSVVGTLAPMTSQCSFDTASCFYGCGYDGECQSACISRDPACRVCWSNNYRHCALNTTQCQMVAHDWLCCLEPLGCLTHAFDDSCRSACDPDPYLMCLDSLGGLCNDEVLSCFP